MGSYLYSDELFPLVIIVIDGRIDPEMAREYWDFQESLIRDKRIYAVLTDLSTAGMATKEYRSAVADRLQEMKDTIPGVCLGTALVLDSPVIRLSLSITFSISPAPVPHKIVASVEQGLGWIEDQFEKEGIPAPDRKQVIEALAKLRDTLPEVYIPSSRS